MIYPKSAVWKCVVAKQIIIKTTQLFFICTISLEGRLICDQAGQALFYLTWSLL